MPPPPPIYAVPGAAVQAPVAEAPLVAVPGPGKTEAQFQADDRVCRADIARLPARQRQPTAAQLRAAQAAEADPNAPPPPPSALPPGAAFLRCMTARGNQVQPLQAQGQALPVYANLPAYPVYAGVGYGYPYFYDDVFLLRYYGGYGYRGYGYGRFGFGGYGGYGPASMGGVITAGVIMAVATAAVASAGEAAGDRPRKRVLRHRIVTGGGPWIPEAAPAVAQHLRHERCAGQRMHGSNPDVCPKSLWQFHGLPLVRGLGRVARVWTHRGVSVLPGQTCHASAWYHHLK